MKSSNINYIPQLDHLRFFAALLVMVFHLAYNSLTVNLHLDVGVSLFFTLSGFLLFLIVEKDKKNILYRKFIYNRFLRIYPLIIVLFFLIIVVMRANFSAIDYLNIFALNMTENGIISWASGDWGSEYLSSFNWWTIGIEFVFYLIFPFMVKFYREYGIGFLLRVLLIIVLLRYGLYYIRLEEEGWKNLNIQIHYSVFGHIDTFIIGMIYSFLYMEAKKHPKIYKILSSYFSLLVSLVLMCSFLLVSNYIDILVYPTLVGIFCGLVIITYVTCFEGVNNKISDALSYLGTISFSLYLLHSFVKDAMVGSGISEYVFLYLHLIFNSTDLASDFLITFIFYMPLTILFASLTYRTIEMPFLKMRAHYLVNPSTEQSEEKSIEIKRK